MTQPPDPLASPEIRWIAAPPASPDPGGPGIAGFRPLPEHFHAGGLHLLEEIARATPDKLAIDDGELRLSYAELLDRVYGAASRLQHATRPGGVVASVVRNTAVAPIIVMACFVTGRTIVPIDASDPLERQAALFAESGAEAVLLQAGERIDESVIPPRLPRIAIDPARASNAPRPDSQDHAGVPIPNAPIYVAFTSGSTGRPKGIAYDHAAFAGMRNFVNTLQIAADDVILGIASLSTGGTRDAFAALCTGATIRIVDLKSDGIGAALRAMAQDRVSILSFVPTVLRSIMRIDGVDASFANLRVLDLYGDRILADDIALFRSKLPPHCRIRVTLASIEVDAVFSWFVDDSKIHGSVVPAGYLVPGKRIALLDADGRSVPTGEVGELLVRGPMAMGGWQAGRLTGGPFLADPDDPSARIYALGDLVRLRPDGLAEYVGRRDRQLKIRGLWANLGEIEAALRSVAGVADAVAIARSGAAEPAHLVAFVVAAPGMPKPTIRALRRAVAAATAEHMAPAKIHFLDSIPRLGGHKPDLLRLDALAAAGA